MDLKFDSLEYHRANKTSKAGKIGTSIIKKLKTDYDLSLAYTPGVAEVCKEIIKDESCVYEYTNYGNRVAVITNGTAVLGLGNIGVMAAKPVMEGKVALFKKLADIDAVNIEINETDPKKFIDIVTAIAPSFAGINLEDIKSPECFFIVKELQKRLNIPVFHDDQYGTAIVVCAALKNALILQNKKLEKVKIVIAGAGSAAIATYKFLLNIGAKAKNIFMVDRSGVLNMKRDYSNQPFKKEFAQDTFHQTLTDVMVGSDVFIGLSTGDILISTMIKSMSEKPIIFALSNPNPEILPELAVEARPDAILATGRSDYPNQVNNALCFPFIFKGALLVKAKSITDQMHISAMNALVEATIDLNPKCILPHVLDLHFGKIVTKAVQKAAIISSNKI